MQFFVAAGHGCSGDVGLWRNALLTALRQTGKGDGMALFARQVTLLELVASSGKKAQSHLKALFGMAGFPSGLACL